MIQLLHELRSQGDSGDASKLCFNLQTFNNDSIKLINEPMTLLSLLDN